MKEDLQIRRSQLYLYACLQKKSFIGYGPEELTNVAVPKYMIGNASKVAVVMPLTLS